MTSDSRQLDKLVKQLQLDQLDRDLFLAHPGKGEGRLFGGLVLAQCVVAAYRTVESGSIHSLHAYFIRPGSHEVPIRYVTYRIRDGKTFTTRDVVAYQSGEAIFQMSCSFTRPEEGASRQLPPPQAPGPEGLPSWDMVRPEGPMKDMMNRWRRERPVEILSVEPIGIRREGDTPDRRTWIRPRGVLPEDPMVHAAVLAYASDMAFLSTARYSHGLEENWGPGANASLDHAMWFHHPPRFDGWLLYTSLSPIAQNARALIHGAMYREDGTHVVSVAQEGLIRMPRPESPQ
ncbi:MAG: acyl-CoA thioesterase II [Dehalococcoidia bacterium]